MNEKTFSPLYKMLLFGNSIRGLILFLGFLLLWPAVTTGSEIRQHGSHVHGVGKLNVLLSGTDLILELDSPAANIVGFEHAPQNEQQKHQIHEALELLALGDKLFTLTPKAQCSLLKADIDSELGHKHENDHKDGHGHEEGDSGKNHPNESGHSDISATYHFTCEKPDNLSAIDVLLFSHFHGFEELEVQLLTPKKQTAVELTPKKSEISL